MVTGGGRGIGRGVALHLCGLGARVLVVGRAAHHLDDAVRAAEDGPGSAFRCVADITRPEGVEEVQFRAEEHLGEVDVLVNNAGLLRAIGPSWTVPWDRWWRDVETNLLGTYLCCRAFVPAMRRRQRGVVVNFSGGGVGSGPFRYGSAYQSSKAAVVSFGETLAAELAGSGVHVYSVSPGVVHTDMVDHQAFSPEGSRYLPNARRYVDRDNFRSPTDVGDLIAWLVRHEPEELSGRMVSVADDRDALQRSLPQIRADDGLVLRRKPVGGLE